MDQGKNMIIILVLPFILFYVSKIVLKNNYFRIKFLKVWLTRTSVRGMWPWPSALYCQPCLYL